MSYVLPRYCVSNRDGHVFVCFYHLIHGGLFLLGGFKNVLNEQKKNTKLASIVPALDRDGHGLTGDWSLVGRTKRGAGCMHGRATGEGAREGRWPVKGHKHACGALGRGECSWSERAA